MAKEPFVLYVNTERKLLTFMELFQIFILCENQVLVVLTVEIRLYFVSLSFLLHVSCKFAPELSLLPHWALC